jgi:hypothetical protein
MVYIGSIEFIIAILLAYKSMKKIHVYLFTSIGLLCVFNLFSAPHSMYKLITNNFETNSTVSNIKENKHGVIYTVHNHDEAVIKTEISIHL